MEIEVRSALVEMDPRLHARIIQLVRSSLERFSRGLRRVVLRLRDLNGPRGGRDKECLLELHRDGEAGLIIRERQDDVLRAVENALARTRRSAGRRRKSRRGQAVRATGLLSAFLLSAACAGPGIEVGARGSSSLADHDGPTYRILEHTLAREPESDQWIVRSLHEALAERGYRRTAGKPSLIVDYKLLVDESEALGEAADLAGGGAVGGNALEDGSVAGQSRSDKILVVTIQDADSLELLWVGWSKAKVSTVELPTTARKAVVEIMKRMPDRQS